MQAHLLSQGIMVQRQRVRTSLRRVDPIHSTLRWGLMSHRRQYSVPGIAIF